MIGAYEFGAGKGDEALKAMTPDLIIDRESGTVIDKNTNQVVGMAPRASYVNGWRVNPYDPNAPGFLPQVDKGMAPTGGGGVANLPGYTEAERGQALGQHGQDLVTINVGGVPRTMTLEQAQPFLRGQGQGAPSLPGGLTMPPGPGAPAAAPTPAGAPPGAAGAAPGVAGISKAQEQFDVGQATDLGKNITAATAAVPAARQAHDNAAQALAYVQAHARDMNPAASYKVAGANYLRTLPPSMLQAVGIKPEEIDQFANDAASYTRLANQGLLEFGKSNLPTRYTERELALGRPVVGAITTAADAATMHWAMQQATANKQLQFGDHAASYKGDPSNQAFEKAWLDSPAGKASIFEDPVFQHNTVGGKPIVKYYPELDAHKQQTGRTVGVVGEGTSAPRTFYPSWSPPKVKK
jgi:hypothetical protein